MRYLLLLLCPILAMAQQPGDSLKLHLREIPRHNLAIDFGIAEPLGDYNDVTRTGLSIAASYEYYFTKNIGLTASLRHSYNETAFESQPSGPEPQNESLTQLSAGLLASRTFNRFQMDGFARLGVVFLNVNDDDGFTSNNDNRFYRINEATKERAAVIDFGLRFNYYFRRSAQVFFSPQIQSTLGKPLVYDRSTTGISPTELQFSKSESNLNNLILSVGVKFALGKEYSSGELRIDGDE